MEHVAGDKQKTDILTKALEKIKFREMRNLIGVEDLSISNLRKENVGL